MPGEAAGTIMLVEDDLTLRDMYQIRLEADGFRVILAANGEEALQLLKKEMPNVIILDIMLPKLNGLDVLEKIKQDESLKKIPVILLTALIQDQARVKGLMSGADDYLVKSEVMPAEVIQKVKIALAKSKKAQKSI